MTAVSQFGLHNASLHKYAYETFMSNDHHQLFHVDFSFITKIDVGLVLYTEICIQKCYLLCKVH